jgi:hypothetical protein
MMWRIGRKVHVRIRSCRQMSGVATHQIIRCEWYLQVLTSKKKCIADLNRMSQTWAEYFINLYNAGSVILAARV